MRKHKRIPMEKEAGGNTAKRRLITAKRRRGPGKPFTGKGDPRNNLKGQINHKALALNKTYSELLVAEGERKHADTVAKVTLKKVEWMVKVVWNAALKGEPWAVELIFERGEGKVKERIEIIRPRNFLVRYADGNGGGA